MARREFPAKVKESAYERANGQCEMPGCGHRLELGRFHYDHRIPDGLGGEPTLDNCQVLCHPCHNTKTGRKDIPAIAKTKRIGRRLKGIKKRSAFACSRNSKWKKRIDGTVVLRDV